MSRRPLLIAFVVVAGFLAGMFLMLRTPEVTPPPVAPKVTASPASVAAAPQATASPQRLVIRTESHLPPVDESQITAEQAAAAAARYRKAARFPRTSRPLDDGIDPIATSRMPKVDYEGDDKHREPRLLAYPSITSFEAPSEVVIYGEVVELRELDRRPERDSRGDRASKLQQFRVGATAMRGLIQTTDGREVATLAFRDDGSRGDGQASDLLFTATYTPDPDHPESFRGEYQVVVLAETPQGDEVTATTGFVYSVQSAHLTGQYRDALADGNLKIEAEVEVEEAGRYRVEGTLVTTADAKMAGYAFGEAGLQPGTHWIPLVYHGLIFHEMKADGPYSLFSLVLSKIDGNTVQESDVVPNAHTTAAYKMSDFSDQPFNDPDRLKEAEHWDGVAARKGNK